MLGKNTTSCAVAMALALAVTACANAPTGAPAEYDSRASNARQELAATPRTSPLAARLLACRWTSGASTEAILGSAGGTIAVAGHTIRIAPGALAEPTTIRVSAPAGELLALRLEVGSGDVSALTRPVEATISYARCGRQDLRHRELTVVRLPELVESVAVATEGFDVGATDDPEGLEVTFELVRRGTYAVAY